MLSSCRARKITDTAPKASGMAVFTARGTVGKAIGGAVAPTASAAPIPLNTPSAKRENNGRDPHVNLVPVRNAVVWGQSSSDVPKANYNESVAASQDPLSMMPMMPVSKPAPWANSSTAANVSSAGGPNANWAEDVDSDDDAHDRAAPAPVKLTAGRDLMNLSHPGGSDFERDGRVVNCSTVRHPDSSSSLVVKESLRNRRAADEGIESFVRPYSYEGGHNHSNMNNSAYVNRIGPSQDFRSRSFTGAVHQPQEEYPQSHSRPLDSSNSSITNRRFINRFDLEAEYSSHRPRNDSIRLGSHIDNAPTSHIDIAPTLGASSTYPPSDQPKIQRSLIRDVVHEGRESTQHPSRTSSSIVGSSPQWERAKSINELPLPPNKMPPPTNFRQNAATNPLESTRSTTSEGRWPTRAALTTQSGSTVPLQVSSENEAPAFHRSSSKPKLEACNINSNNSNDRSRKQSDAANDRVLGLLSNKNKTVHHQNLVTPIDPDIVVRGTVNNSSASKSSASSSSAVPLSSQYTPDKPYASLFTKPNTTGTIPDGSMNAPTRPENGINLLNESDFPVPIESHQSVAVHAVGYISTNEDRGAIVNFSSSDPEETKIKPKVLFDPASNAFREFKGPDKDSSGKHNILKNNVSIAHPPSSRANLSNKPVAVNQPKENDNGRWSKQSLPTDNFSISTNIGPAIVMTRDTIGKAITDTTLSDNVKVEQESSTQFTLGSENDMLGGRQEIHSARKEQRQKERESRGPRTKGVLYKYTADGDIERVLTPEEKKKSDASKSKTKSQSSSILSSSSDVTAKASAVNDSTAEEVPLRSIDLHEAVDRRKKKSRNGKSTISKVDQSVSATAFEESPGTGRKNSSQACSSDMRTSKISAFSAGDDLKQTYSSVLQPYTNIAGNGSGELDIQKVAMEAEANRSLHPIKSFIPGVGLSSILESNKHQLTWTASTSILESSIPPTSRSRVSESFGGLMQSSLLLDDENHSWYAPVETPDATACFGPERYLEVNGLRAPLDSELMTISSTTTLPYINASETRHIEGESHRDEEANERKKTEFTSSAGDTARRSNRNRNGRNKGVQSTHDGMVRERHKFTDNRELRSADAASNDIIKPSMGRGSRSRPISS